MTRKVIILVLAVALGIGLGLGWRSHQATEAERRADRADSLYQATVKAEAVTVRRWRDSLAQVRDSLAVVASARDSAATARADSIRRANQRLQSQADSAVAVLARAQTVRDSIDALRPFPALYEQSQQQFRGVVAQFDSVKLAAADLRRVIATDSTEIRRERQRGDLWKGVADSLDLAVLDLKKHRRPAFSLKVGAGGAVVGGVVALVIRSLVTAKH